MTVPAVEPRRSFGRARGWTLAAFFAGGLALVGAQRLVAAPSQASSARPERRPLKVRVPAEADAATAARMVDEAVLVEVGLELDWRLDPLVRERLATTIAQLAPDPSEPDPLARAVALDLPRRDPLVRARLAEHARRLLPRPGTPPDAELAAFAAAHADELTPSETIVFAQRFAFDEARMAKIEASPETDRGVPELNLGSHPTRTRDALAKLLGEDAARAIAEARPGVWTRVTSRLGLHLVRLESRTPGRMPALAAMRPQVLEAWRRARTPELERQGLARLRAGFDIVIERVGGAAASETRR